MTPTPPQAGERAEASALTRAREFLAGKPRRSTDWMADDILSALVAEIEGSPVGEAVSSAEGYPASLNGYAHDDDLAINALIGKRVRLLALDSGGAGEGNNLNHNEEKGYG